MWSLGSNWLGQVQAIDTEDELEVMLHRAQHLKEVADSLAVRLGRLMLAVLENAFELLEIADCLELQIVQAIYVFHEAVQMLSRGRNTYIHAANDGVLFWQKQPSYD
ncbi:hypothetical protein M422DRAFT_255267 [Sphaerobolus stellatus SS14]|uniref:Uncharacterized protein n=1 Tax=Sphaerobolus stellatus (strain SS14) TaxID=990650 RepID=A0A0C9V402_SPHS4|nr:hypothetical protein M422DRAFT_255267 [Sphaerobolus stellatus SS14]